MPVKHMPIPRMNIAHQLCHASVQIGRITAKESRLWSPEVRNRSKNLSEHTGLMQPFAARGFYRRHKVAFAVCSIGDGCP